MPTDDVKFRIGVKDRTRAAFKRLKRELNAIKHQAGSLKIAVLILAAGFGALTRASFKSIDATAKMADAMSITTESLGALHTAAQLAGVEQRTLDKAIVKMARSIRDADDGLATYIRSFDKLGLNVKALKELAPEEQFFTIQKALGGVTNATDRLAIATDLYGSRAATILNMTNMSFEAFQKLKAETLAVGKALNRIDSNKVEQANDSITRAKDAVEGLGNRIAVGLSPFVKKMADDFFQSALDAEGFGSAVDKGIKTALTAIGWVLDAVRMLEIGWKTLNLGFQGVVAWIVNGWFQVSEAIRNTLNLLPGVEIQMSESFREIAEATKGVMEETYQELVELTNKPLPSEGLKAWADAAVKESSRGAGTFVKNQKTITDANKNAGSKVTKDMLEDAKKQFGISKAQDLANAAKNIPAAISGAYKAGAQIGGPFVGAAFGAAAGIFETKKLSDIAGVSLGGGGGGGGGGSVPSVPSIPSIQSTSAGGQTTQGDITNSNAVTQTIEVHLDGDVILEAVNSGSLDGRLVIDANAVR